MNKITITTTETKEVEVSFPCYTKTEFSHYAVLSEDKVISVNDYSVSGTRSINKNDVTGNAFREGFQFITEQEFCNAYKQTVDTIHAECESFLDSIEQERKDAEEIEQERKDSLEADKVNAYCGE